MSNENIIIKFSQKDNNFIIYEKKNILGVIGIVYIIKYITSLISKDFLNTIEYESSIDLIEKYFCKFDNNGNIFIIGYLESPITSNVEIMMKFYSEINEFKKSSLHNSIEEIKSQIIKNKIEKSIRNLEYLILNHSLKLIVHISNAIKNNNSKNDLKLTLIKYSIFITHKINNIIYTNITETKTDIMILNVEYEQLKNIRSNIDYKIKKIEDIVSNQNLQINKIIDYIDLENEDLISSNSDIKSSGTNSTVSIKNLNNDFVNDEFNDSDYSYSEKSNNKVNIDYLTPNNK